MKAYLSLKYLPLLDNPHRYGLKIKEETINFPDGCVGFTLIFKTKKSARKALGNTVKLEKIEVENCRRNMEETNV